MIQQNILDYLEVSASAYPEKAAFEDAERLIHLPRYWKMPEEWEAHWVKCLYLILRFRF